MRLAAFAAAVAVAGSLLAVGAPAASAQDCSLARQAELAREVADKARELRTDPGSRTEAETGELRKQRNVAQAQLSDCQVGANFFGINNAGGSGGGTIISGRQLGTPLGSGARVGSCSGDCADITANPTTPGSPVRFTNAAYEAVYDRARTAAESATSRDRDSGHFQASFRVNQRTQQRVPGVSPTTSVDVTTCSEVIVSVRYARGNPFDGRTGPSRGRVIEAGWVPEAPGSGEGPSSEHLHRWVVQDVAHC